MRFNYLLIICVSFLFGCSSGDGYEVYHGEAQGTTFLIKHDGSIDFEDQIDSILTVMDDLFSTYKENSVISRFNSSENGIVVGEDFKDFWEKCWELNIESNGYFDPTLTAVFNAYSSMEEGELDSILIIEALMHTGMPLIALRGDSLVKKDELISLNFNAAAQGYSVDKIAEFFKGENVSNFMVEIGGEVYAQGINDKGLEWTIGIDKPSEGERQLIGSLKLNGKSLATSGNYRKFVEIDGIQYGHIINPKTGFPGYSSILSVSVIADKCYRADALATALMNMSSEAIREFDGDNDDIHIVLIERIKKDTVIYVSPEYRERVSL